MNQTVNFRGAIKYLCSVFFVLLIQVKPSLAQPILKQMVDARENRFDGSNAIQLKPVTMQLPVSLSKSSAKISQPTTASQGGLANIMTEDFEGAFPSGLWSLSTGNYAWAKRNVVAHNGSNSAWAIGGGTIGSTLTFNAYYPNSTTTVMTYGPFDLSDANWAAFTFYVWANLQDNSDYFYFMASDDGQNFSGYALYGSTGGDWYPYSLPLHAVPSGSAEMKNFAGKPAVWITFQFQSDASGNLPNGVFIDDIVLQKGMVQVPTIITSFPTPGTSSRGLAWDGTNLWCSDATDDRIYKLNSSGGVISSFVSPGSMPTGMTWDGANLWNADATNDRIYKLSATGSTLTSFASPGAGPAGIAWDGTNMWVSDYNVETIWKLNTSGSIIGSFSAPGSYHYGLTFDGQNLWLLDADVLLMYKIDRAGNILDYCLTPETWPTGLAWDGNYFWMTDRSSNMIYKLQIQTQRLTKDVGVISMDLPDRLTPGDSTLIKVTVKNYGSADQSNFQVGYSINDGAAVTENFSGTLSAGATTPMTFSKAWKATLEGTYHFMAWTQLTGDENSVNDSLPAPQKVVVNIGDVNTPPILNPIGNQAVIAGQSKTVLLSASDSDGDALSFSILINPGFLSISGFSQGGNTATASLVLSPGANLNGNYDASVQVSDGKGGVATEAFTIAVVLAPEPGRWSKISPKFGLSPLSSVLLVDHQRGWIVGYRELYRTVDGGVTWEKRSISPSVGSLTSGYFIDENVGWATASGCIYKTSDGGQTWTMQYDSQSPLLSSIYFIDSSTGWIVGTGYNQVAIILKTTDGGSTWTAQTSPINRSLYSVNFIDSNNGWAVGGYKTIIKTTDGGQTWIAKNSGQYMEEYNSVFFINAQTGWIAGSTEVLKTADGGENWIVQNLGSSRWFQSVFFIDPQLGWLVCQSPNAIYKTTNGGTSWTEVNVPGSLKSVYFADSQLGWAVGEGGLVTKTTDGGKSWSNQSWITKAELWSAYFLDIHTGWLGGSGGVLAKTTDGGSNWTVQNTTGNKGINVIYFADSKNGWACQNMGKILKTTNGGDSWEQISTATTRDFYGMYFVNSQIGWAVGGAAALEGIVFKTTDGGNSWASLGKPTAVPLMDVFFIDANTGWSVGMDGIILKTTNGGASWISQSSGGTSWLTDVYFQDANVGFAVGDGVILKTTNGGTAWIVKKTISGVGEEILFMDPTNGWVVGTDAGVAKGIGGNSAGIHLLSSGASKIWRTEDGGESWAEELLNGSWLLSAFFNDANSGWTIGNNGTIFKYTNNLPLPAPPSDLKALAISQTAITVLWSDNSNNETGFHLYRSDGVSGEYKFLATAGKDTNSYTDTGLTEGTTYWYRLDAFNAYGNSAKSKDASATAGVVLAVAIHPEAPFTFALKQNYPNPFNSSTVIQYSIPTASQVELKLFDLLGREVKVLVHSEQQAGFYKLNFDSQNLPAGLYFYRLQAGEFCATKKMVIVK